MENRYLLIYFSEYKYTNKNNKKYIFTFSTLYNALKHLKEFKYFSDKRVMIIDLLTRETLLDVEYK